MIDLEKKRKRIEMIAASVGVCVVAFFVAPVIFVTIKGLIGIIVALGIVLPTLYVGVPWFAMKMGNWRMKALKAEASKNPLETMENQLKERHDGLAAFRDQLKLMHAEIQNYCDEMQGHIEKYPDK